METRLTIPVSADNFQIAKEQIKAAAKAGAEMLELRTDYLKQLNTDIVKNLTADAKAIAKLPLIVTCRDKKEGGVNNYPAKLRIDVLIAATEAGAEFIDLEYANFVATENRELIERALSEHPHCKLIISAHNFKGKFQNIGKLYRDIETLYPAAIPKLVYTANHINDCFEAFDLLEAKKNKAMIWCMGQAGLISRIIAKKLGSLVTYASIDEKSATAPGQLTIDEFKNLYRYDDIKPDTQLYGVIADPVGHSLSPHIHNACFAAAELNNLYLPLWVQGGPEQFDSFMAHILSRKYLDFVGFSITIPHKTNVLEFTKANFGFVELLTEKIGAANTLIISADGKLKAYNTDYAGALDAISKAMGIERPALKNLPAAVIGAGGVARTVVAGLADSDAKIKIYNRTVKKAEKLAAEFDCEYAGLDELKSLDAKLLINCTSIGMYPKVDKTPLNARCLKKGVVVFDTVYNPAETLLLRQAKELGCKTISGLDMFLNQANSQFKLFTGQTADAEVIQKVCNRIFQK
jgi:3-dehydroquinate dehydratase/shikimate dehydrogenase